MRHPREAAEFHPELKWARLMPPFTFGPRVVPVLRHLIARMPAPVLPAGVSVEVREIPGPEGQPPIMVRILRPERPQAPAPALYWMHGGGFLIGHPKLDEVANAALAKELGLVVVSVAYRLAPEHPYPAPLEDCYAGLLWLHEHAASLGVDAGRIALGGASAGGGLAAGLALLARDRGVVKPAFQLLVYPMLDDRTTLRGDLADRIVRVWTPASNHRGWSAYLGHEPGTMDVPGYAAPARALDLSGLPPAWLGVGTLDLFHDEDLAFARRLGDQGVPCEIMIVPGAFHGFDSTMPRTNVARTFWEHQREALRQALFTSR